MQPNEQEIRERSYFLWQQEGRPDGRAWEHWLRAEAELRAAGSTGSPKPRRGEATRAKSAKRADGSAQLVR